jgi:hypothetical protein
MILFHPFKVVMHNQNQLVLPKKSEVSLIVQRFYEHFRGENCFKLIIGISSTYAGISREIIQDWIKHSEKHGEMKPVFSNKAKLKPVIAEKPFNLLQVDLVDFSSFTSRSNKKTFSYVLAVLDVFSRFLFPRPLVSKEASEVALHLDMIFKVFGYPARVQTDQGSEFKGKTNL